ncbi:hypothetical protein [uncultured Tateyamaria sp.]|uniref:hypothetical protein n=1 Tax=uncultured Tateyamaria sp. TaxID=455651 RepID=UPI00262A7CA6|nr:hypothetical protein [uncultured Tateyamaria sp.]
MVGQLTLERPAPPIDAAHLPAINVAPQFIYAVAAVHNSSLSLLVVRFAFRCTVLVTHDQLWVNLGDKSPVRNNLTYDIDQQGIKK